MKPLLAILAWILAITAAYGATNATREKANVLFVVVDDLKPLLGCYGASWVKSPNLDRLARRGTVFAASHCQVSLCAPSRASLLTGLRPDNTGLYLNPDSPTDWLRNRLPDVVTLPQHFKNHGYITHPIHKVFDGRTVDAGHDSVSWTVPYGPWEMAPGEKPSPGGYQDAKTKMLLAEAANQGGSVTGPATEGCDIPDDAYHDGGVAMTAAKRIREFAQKSQRFFLAVGFVKPHLPFIAPKKYWDLYDRKSLPLAAFQQLPQESPHDLAFYSNSGELRSYSDVPKTGPISEAQQRELIHGYAACVSYIDAQVGLLMQTLEETGINDHTIVCILGDHGYHLGEHGHWGKVTNYEEATRAPLVMLCPGIKQVACVTTPVEFIDVYPTLCDVAGLPMPRHLEGKSLVPLIRGEAEEIHDAVISQMAPGAEAGVMGWTLRTPRTRYIEWRKTKLDGEKPVFTGKVVEMELYDYETDSEERINLARQPDQALALKEHQALFDRLLPHLPKRHHDNPQTTAP